MCWSAVVVMVVVVAMVVAVVVVVVVVVIVAVVADVVVVDVGSTCRIELRRVHAEKFVSGTRSSHADRPSKKNG